MCGGVPIRRKGYIATRLCPCWYLVATCYLPVLISIPPYFFRISLFIRCLHCYWHTQQFNPHLLSPPHCPLLTHHPIYHFLDIQDRPCWVILSDRIMVPSDILLGHTQYRQLQSLSEGWIYPATFGSPSGLLAIQPVKYPIVSQSQRVGCLVWMPLNIFRMPSHSHPPIPGSMTSVPISSTPSWHWPQLLSIFRL